MQQLLPCETCGKLLFQGYTCCNCVKTPGIYTLAQQFDWVSEDETYTIAFNVTAILKAIEAKTISYTKVIVPVDYAWAKETLSQRECNMEYCKSLPWKQLTVPVIFAMMWDSSGLLIDGSHRYMAHVMRRMTEIKGLALQEKSWRPFAIERKL